MLTVDGVVNWVGRAGAVAARGRSDIETDFKMAMPSRAILSVTSHHIVRLSDGAVHCVRCCRTASCASSAASLWSSQCKARPGGQERGRVAPAALASSEAAEVALAAAAACGSPAAGAAAADGMATGARGHAIRAAYGYSVCVRCGAYARDVRGRCRSLGRECLGRFGGTGEHGRLDSAGRARQRRVHKILEGRHPTVPDAML